MRTTFAFLLAAGCLSEGLKVDTARLIDVPAATYMMGSTNINCGDQESGQLCGGDHRPHLVSVDGFQILDREVSRAAYAECIAQKECQSIPGLETDRYRIDRPNSPVMVNDPNLGAQYCQ